MLNFQSFFSFVSQVFDSFLIDCRGIAICVWQVLWGSECCFLAAKVVAACCSKLFANCSYELSMDQIFRFLKNDMHCPVVLCCFSNRLQYVFIDFSIIYQSQCVSSLSVSICHFLLFSITQYLVFSICYNILFFSICYYT